MKILILTSVYRDETLRNKDTSTNVVNLFAKEWVKQEHEVIVVHNAHQYPRVIHSIPQNMKQQFANKAGFQIASWEVICHKEYNDEGVKVWRNPMKKYIPHRPCSARTIAKQKQKIIDFLARERFVPDMITGHWASPQMELVSQLKKVYNCKTAVVLHGMGYIMDDSFDIKKYLTGVDRLGCRSQYQAEQLQKKLSLKEDPFVCYSGIPDAYLQKFSCYTEKYEKIKKWKFVYVGRLIQYKRVDVIIRVLGNLTGVDWELKVIGEGGERENLENLARAMHCDERVVFSGKISRDQVMETLSESHCFIMVSENEVYGLVYLEAMAASCITIASKGCAMDGIIKNGENGFLCEQGDEQELKATVKSLIAKDQSILQKIAEKGYKSVNDYADSKVAKRYLESVMQ